MPAGLGWKCASGRQRKHPSSFPGSRLGTLCLRGSASLACRPPAHNRQQQYPRLNTCCKGWEAEPPAHCVPRREPGNERRLGAWNRAPHGTNRMPSLLWGGLLTVPLGRPQVSMARGWRSTRTYVACHTNQDERISNRCRRLLGRYIVEQHRARTVMSDPRVLIPGSLRGRCADGRAAKATRHRVQVGLTIRVALLNVATLGPWRSGASQGHYQPSLNTVTMMKRYTLRHRTRWETNTRVPRWRSGLVSCRQT